MRDESGFSLLEMVISIAALTLLSGFILQMFVASIHLNRRAYNLDMGSNAAVAALEAYDGADLKDGAVFTQYFDGQWERVTVEQPAADAYVQNVELILPDSIKFILTVNAAEEDTRAADVYASFDTGGNFVTGSGQSASYSLIAKVCEINDNKGQDEIVSMSTRVYAPAG